MVASLGAVDLSMSQGAAVLELLERAGVPPVPEFYELLFNYVSGVEGLFSKRMSDILSGDGGSEHGTVREQLYSEFLAPYENTNETIERMVARITERLRTLDELIVESAKASAAQSVSLKSATGVLGAAQLNPRLMKEWIGRLRNANDAMRQASSRLVTEIEAAESELAATRAELHKSRDISRQDPLTGLANRSGIDEAAARFLDPAALADRKLTVAVVDIDHFKKLNDTYGHPVGDAILRIVARALRVVARSDDVLGRTGGDEFVAVLPDTDLAAAREVAERMRQSIYESDLGAVLGGDVLGGVSASIGVAQFQPDDTIVRLVERADHWLYEAKRRGRNRVVCEGDAEADLLRSA